MVFDSFLPGQYLQDSTKFYSLSKKNYYLSFKLMKINTINLTPFTSYKNTGFKQLGIKNSPKDNKPNVSFSKYDAMFEYNFYEYSKKAVEKDISQIVPGGYELLDKQAKIINKKLLKGTVESSYLEMLLETVKSDKLPTLMLYNIKSDTQLNQNVKDDLDILYDCFCAKKDPKDAFCAEFDSETDADKNTKTGDVFVLKDCPFIKIKAKNGIEELFITKDSYLELFPPIERYAPLQSMRGDCYLIAAYNSVFQNPYSRDMILKMFRQDSEGNIFVSWGYEKDKNGNISTKGIEKKIYPEALESKIEKNPFYYCFAPDALKAIELLLDKQRAFQTYKKINEFFKEVQISNEFNEFCYTTREVELFKKFASGILAKGFSESEAEKFASTDITRKFFCINKDTTSRFLRVLKKISKKREIQPENLKKCSEEEIEYLTLVFERYLNYFKSKKGNSKRLFEEILPIKCYKYLFDDEKKKKNTGGDPRGFYDKLDMYTESFFVNSKEFYRFLKNIKNNENYKKDYIFTASTDTECKNKFFRKNHTYNIEFDENFNFKVTDPHNCAAVTTLNEQEFVSLFTVLFAGFIP